MLTAQVSLKRKCSDVCISIISSQRVTALGACMLCLVLVAFSGNFAGKQSKGEQILTGWEEGDLPPQGPPITRAECVGVIPVLWNGGIQRISQFKIRVLVYPGTNGSDILRILRSCPTNSNFTASVIAEVAETTQQEHPQNSTAELPRYRGRNQTVFTAVVWRILATNQFHALYDPSGQYIHHGALSHVQSSLGFHSKDTIFHTLPVDGAVVASFPPLLDAVYGATVGGTFPRHCMQDGMSFWSPGALVIMPSRLHTVAYLLPVRAVNMSVIQASNALTHSLPTPALLERRIFVENRAYSIRPRKHLQYRGYRHEVMESILKMARNLTFYLDVSPQSGTTFAEQWSTIRSYKYLIVTEGAFTGWFPFLRPGSICLVIYQYYGTAWHIPDVHLPLALLGELKSKIVFCAIYKQHFPTAEELAALLADATPQVSVATFPKDLNLERELRKPARFFADG